MNFIKQNISYISLTFVLFTVGIFLILPIMPSVSQENSTFVSTASAFGTSGCGGCGESEGPGEGGGEQWLGCTDPNAINYNPSVDGDDGSCVYPNPPSCSYLNADKVTLPYGGGDVNLTWASFDGTSAILTPDGSAVELNGAKTVNVTNDTTFVFQVTNTDGSDSCQIAIDVEEPPVVLPSCDAFTATPSVFGPGGGTATLAWETTNANSVSIDNGIGAVAEDGSQSVSITGDITYTLTAQNSAGSVTCAAPIIVEPPVSAPSCDAFSASPSALPYGGGTSVLSWATTNVDSVSIDNGIGAVNEDGSQSVTVNQSITYTLTASKAGYDDVTCIAPIAVGDPTPEITCGQNVTFNASTQSLPKGGGNVDFTWTTTGLDSVSFTGLTSTSLSGNESKNITSDETVTLIGTKGSKSISCPLPINVRTGGGSSSPRCDLDISDEKITRGQEITLKWDTSRAREVKITDSFGKVLLDTDNNKEFDGEMKLKPTKDTEYTLLSKRGTRERTCKVEVEMENNVTVLETRSQEPRVAGISLTQVPYTGFEAGPALTIIFYFLLTVWGLFIAYIVVIRRDSIGGVSLAGSHDHVPFTDVSTDADPVTDEPIAEEYVDAVVASTATQAPVNLPTATPVIGYEAFNEDQMDESAVDESIEMTELENRAHAQKVLLSSDAMRFFMNATETGEARIEKLDAVITEAKASFPSEGGWVALNLARIETLITDEEASAEVITETAPINGGSLAEAIVEGNIVAAYQMIAHRPMIALADAASELDAVYRSRKGETVQVSDMLAKATENLSTQQLESAIAALTGAVDGTYDDEASAVKMAIMKAVKATS